MTRRFHVTHVIDSLARSGGSERQLLVNLSHFSHRGLRHSLVVIRPGADSRIGEVPGQIPTTVLFGNDDEPSRLSIGRKLYRQLKTDRPDLIHCALPESSYACRLVGPLLRVPVVESLVNISHEPIRAVDNPNVSLRKLRAHALLDRLTMRHFAGYHAVGPTVAESWHRTVGLPMEKMAIIPRGVSAPDGAAAGDERQVTLEELGLSDDSVLLLCVGRQEPQKGHRYAIQAMPDILESVPTAHLIIAGRSGTSTRELLDSIESSGLSRNVHILGSRSDIQRLLLASDIFVFPSLFEGNGGNALIEAMSLGCPVVVSDAPPMTEIVNEQVAVLFRRCDSAALAKAVIDLADNRYKGSQMGREAQERARSMPNAVQRALEVEEWYADILATRQRRQKPDSRRPV